MAAISSSRRISPPAVPVLQKLLSALEAAQRVTALLGSGGSRQELERLCNAFVADAQVTAARAVRAAPLVSLIQVAAWPRKQPYRLIPLSRPGLAPQESQLTLLELADRHQEALPLNNQDYCRRLSLAADQKRVEGAEAQLADLLGSGHSTQPHAAGTQAGGGPTGLS